MFLVGSLVRGSTEVVDLVDCVHATKAKQAAAGRIAAQRRQETLRGKIIAASKETPALHPLHPGWPVTLAARIDVDPKRYGLKTTPCDETLRAAQAWLLAKSPQLAAMTVPSSVARST